MDINVLRIIDCTVREPERQEGWIPRAQSNKKIEIQSTRSPRICEQAMRIGQASKNRNMEEEEETSATRTRYTVWRGEYESGDKILQAMQ